MSESSMNGRRQRQSHLRDEHRPQQKDEPCRLQEKKKGQFLRGNIRLL